MSQNDYKINFTKIFLFPEKYLNKSTTFECYLKDYNRATQKILDEFQLKAEDYMRFQVSDDDHHFLRFLICNEDVADDLVTASIGQGMQITGEVIGTGTMNIEREPLIKVTNVVVLDKMIESYWLPDEYDYIDDLDIDDDIYDSYDEDNDDYYA